MIIPCAYKDCDYTAPDKETLIDHTYEHTMTQVNTVTNDDELQQQINAIRDKIIDASNSGYTEAINDRSYFDKPLMQLITADRARAVIDGQIKTLETLPGRKMKNGYLVEYPDIQGRITELQALRKSLDNKT